WYEQDVLVTAADATQEALLALAFQIEGEAKVNIVSNGQVDTGFMLNSSYIVGGDTNSFRPRAEVLTSPKTGQRGMHDTVASPPPVADEEVVVGFAADYAIYQESERPFLYPAAQRVASQAAGVIETVGKRYFGD
ncbi:MAG: hypothetical protein KF832_31070, partial [Caldilineaceae bacterium]|nr:hypothetical protein [Caldilineaceae bacterium]